MGGIFSKAAGFCQFRVTGPVPDAADFCEFFASRLNRQAFAPIESDLQESSQGWARITDTDQTSFSVPGDFWFDTVLSFSYRVDTRKVPGVLVKKHCKLKEARFLAENPQMKRVPRQKKAEIKDLVRAELLAKSLPVPATCDLSWNVRDGVLSVYATSTKTVDAVHTLLQKTFPEFAFQLITPYARALAVLPEEQRMKFTETHQNPQGILAQLSACSWLGKEFLQWLLLRSVDGLTDYVANDAGEEISFSAYMDRRVVLCGDAAEGKQKVSVAGHQDSYREVMAGLEAGKEITEASLVIEREDVEWLLTVKADTFAFSACKADGAGAGDSEDEGKSAHIIDRVALDATCARLFMAMLETFLREKAF